MEKKQKMRFKGKPIKDYPDEFMRLIRLAMEKVTEVNEEFPDVDFDLPGYYLGRHLRDYFNDGDSAIEELKSILYDDHLEKEYEDIERELRGWLRWYFPKMLKAVRKGMIRFTRGFRAGLPGADKEKVRALNALEYLTISIRDGNEFGHIAGRRNNVRELDQYLQNYQYLKYLEQKCPIKPPKQLSWNPGLEKYTRWAAKEYREKGLEGYRHMVGEFVLANNEPYSDAKIDESRFLPEKLWGKVDFGKIQNCMYIFPFPARKPKQVLVHLKAKTRKAA
jgi:hypothetical protein